MPAINFSPQFVEAVRSWHKRQTIRRVRMGKGSNGPIKAGDKLILKSGMRTPEVSTIHTVICTEVTPIVMWEVAGKPFVEIDGKPTTAPERLALARADGFTGTLDMVMWFKRRYLMVGSTGKWRGVIIKW